MRAGLPVIGSRIAGIPELIIDGETGFVVDLDDTLLSDRLHYIINHKELLPKWVKLHLDFSKSNSQ